MSLKIGFMIPYESTELRERIKKLEKELGIEIICRFGSFAASVPVARKMLEEHPDIVAFVARINTASFLRKALDVPVVSIHLSHFEFSKAIAENSQIDKSPVMLIMFEGGFIYDTDAMSKVCGIEVKGFITNYLDNHESYARIVREYGCNRAITTNLDVAIPCTEHGIEVIFVPISEDILRRALKEAISEGKKRQVILNEKKSLTATINALDFGLLFLNEDGYVEVCNKPFCEIIQSRNDLIEGLSTDEIHQNWPFISKIINVAGEDVIEYKSIKYWVTCIKINTSKAYWVFNSETLKKYYNHLKRRINKNYYSAKNDFNKMIAQDSASILLKEKAMHFAKTDSNILITGESGTGKDVLAQCIHNASKRSSFPFVPINCAALPESLLESELFGYKEGAFTGAQKGGKVGLIEMADKGTLFLDEISSMPLNIQTKLLRVVQEKEISKLGDTEITPVDCRLICATNQDLEELVTKGLFRDDLYYRINVLPIRINPIRERPTDITLLAKTFFEEYYSAFNFDKTYIPIELLPLLHQYNWPGNIRQLKAFVEMVSVLSDNGKVDIAVFNKAIEELPFSSNNNGADENNSIPKVSSLRKIEEEQIRYVYKKHNGNLSKIREELGISRTTLWKRLKELGITE